MVDVLPNIVRKYMEKKWQGRVEALPRTFDSEAQDVLTTFECKGNVKENTYNL